jgi:TM2 domain-containing membrane protein YozV
MYKIIGGDGREYGPVSAEQLKQWVAEGRAGPNTKVREEGNSEWKLLSSVAELTTGPGLPPYVRPPGIHAEGSVNLPPSGKNVPGAEKKIVAGICAILLGHFGVHKFILGYTPEGLVMLLVTILTCGIGGVVMWVIGLVEGITYLTKSDEDFVAMYIINRKGWF